MTVRLSATPLCLSIPIIVALAAPPLQRAQERASNFTAGPPCADARDAATRALHDLSPVGTRPVRLRIDHAFVFELQNIDEETNRGVMVVNDESDEFQLKHLPVS